MSRRLRRTLLFLAGAVLLSAAAWHVRPRGLLDMADPLLTFGRNSLPDTYRWLDDNCVFYETMDRVGVDSLVIENVNTHQRVSTKVPLELKRELGWLVPQVSPDGQWLLMNSRLADGSGDVYFFHTRRGYIGKRRLRQHTYDIHLLADSRHWIALYQDTRTSAKAVVMSVDNSERLRRVPAPSGAVIGSLADNSLFVLDAPYTDQDKVTLTRWWPLDDRRPQERTEIHCPDAKMDTRNDLWELKGSATGRIAQVTRGQLPPAWYLRWAHAARVLRKSPANREYVAVCLSRFPSSETQLLGFQSGDAPQYTDEHPDSFEWRPGGKALSFVYRRKLWRIDVP